jgi:molybdate transport system regulatory protein
MKTPHVHVRLDFSESCSVGPGKIGLLEAVERTGSLSAAARSLGVSYRRAWLLLHSVNNSFSEPAVELSVGGKDGGGTQLTDFGRTLTRTYRNFAADVDALSARAFADLRPRRAAKDAPGLRRPMQRSLVAVPTAKKKRVNP